MKVGSKSNFGWGKDPKFAARCALRSYYGGNDSTVGTHITRFKDFIKFSKSQGLGRDISKYPADHLKSYAADVARRYHNGDENVKTASYAHNLISTANRVYEAFTGKNPGLSPRDEIGVSRSGVRATLPSGLDSSKVKEVADQLAHDHPHTAATINLERNLGLRAKETALMDCKSALREAEKTGRVNITEGTKGGRGQHVDRYVPITKPEQLAALKQAAAVQGNGKNLVPAGKTWVSYYNQNRYVLGRYQTEISKQHDLRAAYACERYQDLTGCKAPICREADDQKPDQETDRGARLTISKELGHGRIDVTNSYLGK